MGRYICMFMPIANHITPQQAVDQERSIFYRTQT